MQSEKKGFPTSPERVNFGISEDNLWKSCMGGEVFFYSVGWFPFKKKGSWYHFALPPVFLPNAFAERGVSQACMKFFFQHAWFFFSLCVFSPHKWKKSFCCFVQKKKPWHRESWEIESNFTLHKPFDLFVLRWVIKILIFFMVKKEFFRKKVWKKKEDFIM